MIVFQSTATGRAERPAAHPKSAAGMLLLVPKAFGAGAEDIGLSRRSIAKADGQGGRPRGPRVNSKVFKANQSHSKLSGKKIHAWPLQICFVFWNLGGSNVPATFIFPRYLTHDAKRNITRPAKNLGIP